MARNKVQFQKGISFSEFLKDSATGEQCVDALVRWRWPEGFGCSVCHGDKYCQLQSRNLYQCNRCHHQTSVTAGSVFQSTKRSLTTWFQGIDSIPQDKRGICALELHRLLGISYHAARRMQQKLIQVMLERDNGQPLSGSIELDDAYLGGERTGGKRGRGAAGKTPFVAAVATTSEGQPTRVKCSVVKGFRASEIAPWSQQHLRAGSTVISDGLACFNSVVDAGCEHDKRVCGGGRASVEGPECYGVNRVLGKLKGAQRSTYHPLEPKYAQRYSAEFQYRFNRRFSPRDLMPRLAYVCLRTPPMPEKLLKIGLA